MTRLEKLRQLLPLVEARRPGWDAKVKAGILDAVYSPMDRDSPTARWLDVEILRAEAAEADDQTGPIQPGEIT